MTRILARIRRAPHYVGMSLWVLAGAAPAWGQQGPVDQGAQEDWVLSYALVILCVGLGAFAVCRPARRSSDVRRPV
jgi:hypothetical protein